jgi:hypothetical protein
LQILRRDADKRNKNEKMHIRQQVAVGTAIQQGTVGTAIQQGTVGTIHFNKDLQVLLFNTVCM